MIKILDLALLNVFWSEYFGTINSTKFKISDKQTVISKLGI